MLCIEDCLFSNGNVNFRKYFMDVILIEGAEIELKQQQSENVRLNTKEKREKHKQKLIIKQYLNPQPHNKINPLHVNNIFRIRDDSRDSRGSRKSRKSRGSYNASFWLKEDENYYGKSFNTINKECYDDCCGNGDLDTPFIVLKKWCNISNMNVDDLKKLRELVKGSIKYIDMAIDDVNWFEQFNCPEKQAYLKGMETQREEQRMIDEVFGLCRIGHEHDPANGFYTI